VRLKKIRSFAEVPTWILIPAILFFAGAAGFFGLGLAPGWAAWLEMQRQLGWSRLVLAIGVMLANSSFAFLCFGWVANMLRKGLDTRLHV
jgi:hypothetical protein